MTDKLIDKLVPFIEGQWFPFFVDDRVELELSFKIRRLSPEVFREACQLVIRGKKRKRKLKKKDRERLAFIIANYVLEDYKGIGDEEGPLKNSPENKEKIISLPLKCGGKILWEFILEKAGIGELIDG